MLATMSSRFSKIATAFLALLVPTTGLEAAQPRSTEPQLERAFVTVFGHVTYSTAGGEPPCGADILRSERSVQKPSFEVGAVPLRWPQS